MPPKRPPFPSSSGSESRSSEEEEEEEEQQMQEVEGSDDSDSPPKAAAKPVMSNPKEVTAPAAKPPASGSESSESDAKPPPPRRPSRVPDPSIKPITSKPMNGIPNSKKKASRQGTEKRKRKESEEEEEEVAAKGMSGKKLFQRVWTEEDEIAILKGMIHAKSCGDEPASAIGDFLKSIEKSLHSEFTKTQLADKMRRLKMKYKTNLRKSKKGASPSFAKPHDLTVFKLSKKIWGGDVVRDYGDDDDDDDDDDMKVENAEKKGGKEEHLESVSAPVKTSPRTSGGDSAVAQGFTLVDGEDGEGRAGALYPKLRDAVALLEAENGGSLFAGSLSQALDLLEPETAKALEERWRKHFMAGLKCFLERSELKENLLKSLIEALENA